MAEKNKEKQALVSLIAHLKTSIIQAEKQARLHKNSA